MGSFSYDANAADGAPAGAGGGGSGAGAPLGKGTKRGLGGDHIDLLIRAAATIEENDEFDTAGAGGGSAIDHLDLAIGQTVCPICRIKTSSSSNLKVHILTHTGERPHACHLCSYRATEPGTLKGHIRTHTGEKPYGCDLCTFRSAHRRCVTRHVKTEHPIAKDPPESTVEDNAFGTANGLESDDHAGQHDSDNKSSEVAHTASAAVDATDDSSPATTRVFGPKSVASKLSSVGPASKKTLHKCPHCEYTNNHSGTMKRHIQTHLPTLF